MEDTIQRIVGTAIGIIFVYSLLSILVTQINSLIANFLNLRARQLKKSIQDLITDGETQAKVLGHPLVDLIETTVRPEERLSAQAARQITDSKEKQVPYLSPDIFVDALVGVLKTRSEKTLYRPIRNALAKLPNTVEKSRLRELVTNLQLDFSEVTLRDIHNVIEDISDDSLRQEVAQSLNKVESTLDVIGYKPPELVALMDGVRKLNDKAFQTAMETVLSTAETMEQAEAQLKEWFNGAMRRARDVYSQRIGLYSAIAGTVVALILNIDTLYMARIFWDTPELRTSLVQAANEFQDTGAITTDSGITIQIPPQTSTEGEDGTTEPAQPDAGGEDGEDEEFDPELAEEQVRDIGRTVQALIELDLPIGWQNTEVTEELIALAEINGRPDPRDNPRNIRTYLDPSNDNFLGLWLEKLLGLVLTGLAAGQGAPFWFDLLGRISGRQQQQQEGSAT